MNRLIRVIFMGMLCVKWTPVHAESILERELGVYFDTYTFERDKQDIAPGPWERFHFRDIDDDAVTPARNFHLIFNRDYQFSTLFIQTPLPDSASVLFDIDYSSRLVPKYVSRLNTGRIKLSRFIHLMGKHPTVDLHPTPLRDSYCQIQISRLIPSPKWGARD